mmetsp:Transcript_10142/g.28915  ORF Transcript_10142/g.28915 Transcript_10142/m.28915 type:complete len:112 (+) Transcript_10142:545-880(+)
MPCRFVSVDEIDKDAAAEVSAATTAISPHFIETVCSICVRVSKWMYAVQAKTPQTRAFLLPIYPFCVTATPAASIIRDAITGKPTAVGNGRNQSQVDWNAKTIRTMMMMVY